MTIEDRIARLEKCFLTSLALGGGADEAWTEADREFILQEYAATLTQIAEELTGETIDTRNLDA